MGIFLTLMQIFSGLYLVRWTPHFCGACWCQCSRSPQCYRRRQQVSLTNSLRNSRSFTRILRKLKNTFSFQLLKKSVKKQYCNTERKESPISWIFWKMVACLRMSMHSTRKYSWRLEIKGNLNYKNIQRRSHSLAYGVFTPPRPVL